MMGYTKALKKANAKPRGGEDLVSEIDSILGSIYVVDVCCPAHLHVYKTLEFGDRAVIDSHGLEFTEHVPCDTPELYGACWILDYCN